MKSDLERTFQEGYNEYREAIFRFCFFKLSDREKAFDVTQEVFIRFWNELRKDKEVRHVKAFLYTVARNLIIDEYRRKDTLSLDRLTESGFDPDNDDYESIEKSAYIEEIKDALEELDDLYRDVVILRYIEGYPPKDIADILDVSENVVSVRLNRAVKKLKVVLKVEL